MKKHIQYYIVVISLFLGICAPTLWTEGMFMDGLYYASIARNLSEGLGSFWSLHLTNYSFPVFNEHPPFAIWLQSLIFYCAGDNIYVERIYSLSTFLFTGLIIHLIWKEIINKEFKSLSWIPLFFWVIIPLNSWSCSNNILENTMNIFVALAVLFSLKSLKKSKLINIFFSGIFLALAFFSKGFTGLFPLSIFFWHFIVFREIKIKEVVLNSSYFLFCLATPFMMLFFFYPDAADTIHEYINNQVIRSIEEIRTVNNRFYIIKKTLLELLPGLIICLIVSYFSFKKDIKNSFNEKKSILFFLLLALSGVIPIMLSMKQSGFYIVTTLPFFSIAMGILVAPHIHLLTNKRNIKSHIFSISIFIVSILFSIKQIGKITREQDLISDIKLILNEIPLNSTISIEKNMRKNYQLIGYFARYGNVSLNHLENENYHLRYSVNKHKKTNYQEVKINTKTLTLFLKHK